MNKISLILSLLSLVFIFGCKDRSESTSGQRIADKYGISFNDELISLHDWDDQIDLKQILGPPLSEEIEVVKGDGLTGSLLKKQRYDGLNLELFSPEGNEKTFWLIP